MHTTAQRSVAGQQAPAAQASKRQGMCLVARGRPALGPRKLLKLTGERPVERVSTRASKAPSYASRVGGGDARARMVKELQQRQPTPARGRSSSSDENSSRSWSSNGSASASRSAAASPTRGRSGSSNEYSQRSWSPAPSNNDSGSRYSSPARSASPSKQPSYASRVGGSSARASYVKQLSNKSPARGRSSSSDEYSQRSWSSSGNNDNSSSSWSSDNGRSSSPARAISPSKAPSYASRVGGSDARAKMVKQLSQRAPTPTRGRSSSSDEYSQRSWSGSSDSSSSSSYSAPKASEPSYAARRSSSASPTRGRSSSSDEYSQRSWTGSSDSSSSYSAPKAAEPSYAARRSSSASPTRGRSSSSNEYSQRSWTGSSDSSSSSSYSAPKAAEPSYAARRSSSASPTRGRSSSSSEYSQRSWSGSSGSSGSSGGSSPARSSSNVTRANNRREKYSQLGRFKGLDEDISDDQQDITRGRDMVDSLYQGFGSSTGGTHNAVLSSSDYLSNAQRTLNNIEDGFYISPAFLDKISIHIAKNFLDLPKIKVPLILGIWGGKGQGKTFQCNLAYKKLGINPIVMSAGELESGNAGEPAKLIRQRYREASDIIKKGRMCSLFINDLDAGAGRMGTGTQYTVNNQLVNATLMNIADNPTNVQLPGVYKNEDIPRVPIVCTGNDFSTLYAPLIRDGRMEKFYWAPTREDRIGVAIGIFQHDGVDRNDVERLVDTFPGQSIDFFGALRARVYDDKVREFVEKTGIENIGKRLVNSREGKVEFQKPSMTIDNLLEYGNKLVEEQENVKRVQLAEKYMSGAELAGKGGGQSLLA